jgi:hypothetical protein
MIDHFDALAPLYDRLIGPPDLARLRALLDLPTTGWVLDAGGGTGRIAAQLRLLAGHLVLLDRFLTRASTALLLSMRCITSPSTGGDRRAAACRLAAAAGGHARRPDIRIGACAARAALDALAHTGYSERRRNLARDRQRWGMIPDQREHWRSRARSGAAVPAVICESRLANQRRWWSHEWTTSLATARISNAGGCSRCFFTAHCSAARITAARYCSGKSSGSSMSSRTSRTMPVSGAVSTC